MRVTGHTSVDEPRGKENVLLWPRSQSDLDYDQRIRCFFLLCWANFCFDCFGSQKTHNSLLLISQRASVVWVSSPCHSWLAQYLLRCLGSNSAAGFWSFDSLSVFFMCTQQSVSRLENFFVCILLCALPAPGLYSLNVKCCNPTWPHSHLQLTPSWLQQTIYFCKVIFVVQPTERT